MSKGKTRRPPSAHATQNRFAVIAQSNGASRVLQRFASRTEAEAYLRVAAKSPGLGQLAVQDLVAGAAAIPNSAHPPPLVSARTAYYTKLEDERRKRPVSPLLLLSVLLLFAILFAGLFVLYIVNEQLLTKL